MPFGAPSTPSAKGGYYPLANPTMNARFLRILAIGIAIAEGQESAHMGHRLSGTKRLI